MCCSLFSQHFLLLAQILLSGRSSENHSLCILSHDPEVPAHYICRRVKLELSAVCNQQSELEKLTEEEENSGLKLNETDLDEYKAIRQEVALQTSMLRQNMAGLECQLTGKQVSTI